MSVARLVSMLGFRISRLVTSFDNTNRYEDVNKSDESESLMNRRRRI